MRYAVGSPGSPSIILSSSVDDSAEATSTTALKLCSAHLSTTDPVPMIMASSVKREPKQGQAKGATIGSARVGAWTVVKKWGRDIAPSSPFIRMIKETGWLT